MLKKAGIFVVAVVLSLVASVVAYASTATDMSSMWAAVDVSTVQTAVVTLFLAFISIGLIALVYTYVQKGMKKGKQALMAAFAVGGALVASSARADTAADMSSMWAAVDVSTVQTAVVTLFLAFISIGLIALVYTYVQKGMKKGKQAL